MNYKVTHQFEASLEDLLRAREDRYKNLDKFPDLKNVELIEEKKEGNMIFQKRKIHFGSALPTVVAQAMGDASLMEESSFDTTTNTHNFKMFPPGKEGVVTITGVSVYRSIGEKTSERSYDVTVKSSVMFLGSLIEATVEEIHKHSLEKDRNSLKQFLGIS